MRIIGLWNPDHLSKQTTLISTIEPSVTGYINDDGGNYALFSAHSMSNGYWSWNVVKFNNRSWMRVNCTTSASLTAKMIICQPTTSSSYPGLRAAGTRYVYHGVRIYVTSCKASGTLLNINGVNSYTAANLTEYFVEVVEDLTVNTRRIFVNGSQVSTETAGEVAVGSTMGSLLNAMSHGFYITDYYIAASEASDIDPPARLGKISVRTLPPTGMTGGDKFTVVGSTETIPALLGAGRQATAPASITEYVNSDSNGGIATLLFTAPNKDERVIGAMGRVAVVREPVAQARAYVDAGLGELSTRMMLTDTTGLLPICTPISVATPDNGWSESELGNVTIKIWSKRSV